MFFKIRRNNHNWKITEKSNVLQQDDMGYPLRLFICTCSKCGKTEHKWIDDMEAVIKNLKDGKDVLIKWENV